MDWTDKKILVGVTGSIAIFKACELVSQIRQKGAQVWVLATRGACQLVSPLTFRALSAREPLIDLFAHGPSPLPHITAADWGDAFVIAPATGHIIAKLAAGLADDPVSTVALSWNRPIILAPAMETKMWDHPATQENVQKLKQRGAIIVGPEEGWLASGKKGTGRMASLERILDALKTILFPRRDLEGWKVVVTAGATREPMDPIRFLSNRSSGKMGCAVAEVAHQRGAQVILVAGHMDRDPPTGVSLRKAETAQQMLSQVLSLTDWFDVLIATAAVSDFTFEPATGKITRTSAPMTVTLYPTADILKEVRKRRPDAFLVGFAAETGDPIQRARQKLQEKGLDLIVANDVTRPDSGFGTETNLCHFLFSDGTLESLPLLRKREVAEILWDRIAQRRHHHFCASQEKTGASSTESL
ncbi:MAG: bifunctional phosphopantothenoylcysteine decarboxylase/phosphopantothenate--cysteine ligase CoaBC [Armatimonadetes bacterium]|nr:bifunctional phosphopantothenoylcysteine decarboxylase/phosphopantothenate--cysteine ligase CoaBC [Armatimonadota bacterium]MDW8120992.1 bifunctional phosphopantothenoylcysteine decarboxylase/phosphopantothenate--cysteine ligase CoaBC [Armatimonadota bacterium]